MNTLKNLFKKPSAKSLAQDKIEEAQRQLLDHESAASYHAKMAEYCRETIVKMGRHTVDTVQL